MTDLPPKPKRLWYQFSLRTLLVLLTVFCVWLGWTAHRVSKQQKAVRWVQEIGGTVNYDFQLDEQGDFIKDAEPPGAHWLRARIGMDWFADVVKVELYGAQVTDLSPLSNLPELRRLSLGKMPITDLSPFANLKNLELLYLSDTPVSDLAPLVNLTNLELLFLDNTPVSDITPLSHLTNLRLLSLYGTQVKDVTPIGELTSLKSLNFNAARVSEEDYKTLQQALPNCDIVWWPRADRPP